MNGKITEELVFLTPAIICTLKSLIQIAEILKTIYDRNTNGFLKGGSFTYPTFCLKLLIENEGNII
jgi:hypothetical protein